ncbi:MAG: hypothetical protein A2992_08120 [Elusimicrobia bacterium RIFCSPLOWO2_01_FULL_59_12]|nr:MAG: hypothetical protein A2992_08120 [Elusimicrobia bacterium RIFCSPLOWO2_01_FULL_59_12]
MNGELRSGRWGMGRTACLTPWLIAHCAVVVLAVDPTAPRLFFSDANISFRFPNNWTLQPNFPYGPLFTKPARDGSAATISCAISAPLESHHVSSDISLELLKMLARRELAAHQPGYKAIAERDRTLSGHNVFEITWENTAGSGTLRHQTVYFFVENRVYALTLQSRPKTFRWVMPDFQNWIQSLRILSRKDAGALEAPAHGGLWIHQTGGAKIVVPDPWLIAVSDDRTLGATLVQGAFNAALTATVELSTPSLKGFSRRDRKDAVKAVRKKGLRIVRETEDAFHGFPSFQVRYEGMLKERVVKGIDLWVLSPKARWLITLEGDVTLYNSLAEQFDQILKEIEFI